MGEAVSVILCCGGVLLRDDDDERINGPLVAGRYDDTERDNDPTACTLRLSPLLPLTAVKAAEWSGGRGGGERVRSARLGDVGAEAVLVCTLSAAAAVCCLGGGWAVMPLPFMRRVHSVDEDR